MTPQIDVFANRYLEGCCSLIKSSQLKIGAQMNVLCLYFKIMLFTAFVGLHPATAQQTPAPTQSKDPYDITIDPANKASYGLKIRIISRGIKVDSKLLTEQIQATEKIFSQCDGVNFKLEVTESVNGSYTKSQDNLINFEYSGENTTMFVSPEYFDFYEPYRSTRRAEVMDIHLADAFSDAARAQKNYTTFLGQSVNSNSFNWLWLDPRENKNPTLEEYGGNSVILAFNLLKFVRTLWIKGLDKEKTKPKKPVYLYGFKERHSSLLAHEIGHILLETQTSATTHEYKDHHCPGLNDYCPSDYLMSGGGAEEREFYKPPNFKKIIGYTSIPKLDLVQCEQLKNHSLVQKK